MTTVLVLGGGPDAEREVSLRSSRAVSAATEQSGRFAVRYEVIGRPTLADLRRLPGDVIFPVLHGRWGEGGPLQELLAQDGRPFVGCGAPAARLAMDKVATKSLALAIGCPATATAILDPRDEGLPLPLPFVVKPVHEGSTVGLFVCRTPDEWRAAHRSSAESGKACMIEPYIKGRELTVGVVDRAALPIIEITPADGLYDYEAKYNRDDTRYDVNPRLPAGVGERIVADTLKLAAAMGVRHLCRVDFMLDAQGRPWLLEVNTMPGFTDHSLVPMAARATPPGGPGLEMPALCARLVELALRDAQGGAEPKAEAARPARAGAARS